MLGFNPFVFSSASMLFWGLAAAAPILIHLWNRRKFREADWAAMQFLLAAVKKNTRRIQIEQLLLLLVRCLILLLLAVALADVSCLWDGAMGGFAGGGGRTHTLIVMDTSYSMEYQQEDETRLDNAKTLARQIVREGREGDGFSLVSIGPGTKLVIGPPAFDPGDVTREIEQLELEYAPARLDIALAELEALVQTTRKNHPRLATTEIYMLTDLGANTWQRASTSENERRLESIEQLARITLLDVGQAETTNSAILQVESRQAYLTPGQSARFEVQVGSDNPAELPTQIVRMSVDGQLVSQREVRFGESEIASVELSHRFDSPGLYAVEFRLEEDRLAADNTRHLVVEVKSTMEVLALGDSPGGTRFLRLALSPQETGQAAVRTVPSDPAGLLSLDLARFDAIFASNVARFTREEAEALKRYVAQGGGLVLVLGDRVDASNYNSLLAEDTFLPATLNRPSPRGNYFLDPRQYEHAIVAPFRGQQAGGLLTTPVWKFFEVEPSEEGLVETALWFDSGDPAIISRRQVGTEEGDRRGGTVTLVTLPATTEALDTSVSPPLPWTAWPTWPSFPPLVQELLADAVAARRDRHNLTVGQTYHGVLPPTAALGGVEISMPDGRTQRVQATTGGQRMVWAFDRTDLPGIYEANPRGGDLSAETGITRFAVNVDSAESDLSRVPGDELPPSLQPGQRQNGEAGAERISAQQREIPLFRYFLVLVLSLLFVESWLAFRFSSAGR
ncbi:MAG: BatA domain-containing protein [Pirellulaceae bacterium]